MITTLYYTPVLARPRTVAGCGVWGCKGVRAAGMICLHVWPAGGTIYRHARRPSGWSGGACATRKKKVENENSPIEHSIVVHCARASWVRAANCLDGQRAAGFSEHECQRP